MDANKIHPLLKKLTKATGGSLKKSISISAVLLNSTILIGLSKFFDKQSIQPYTCKMNKIKIDEAILPYNVISDWVYFFLKNSIKTQFKSSKWFK